MFHNTENNFHNPKLTNAQLYDNVSEAIRIVNAGVSFDHQERLQKKVRVWEEMMIDTQAQTGNYDMHLDDLFVLFFRGTIEKLGFEII
jgi:hypothetical protein